MAVLLGNQGLVELRRTQTDEVITGTVAQSDVNAVKDRFSFDFQIGMLITGDQVEIRTTDESLLSFVAASGWTDNQQHRDGIFYLFVDEIGGIRLYQTFDEAISGEVAGRVDLIDPGRDVPVSVEVRNNNERILGQVLRYELNTERDVIDITSLSDEFKRNYSGLISGSGRITCVFDYEIRSGDPLFGNQSAGLMEVPLYLNQLLLRTRIGSEFFGKVTLVGRGPKPYGTSADDDDEVWYEFDARITNVGMSFESGEGVDSTIDFVTTGEIRLRTRYVTNYLLQENALAADRIRQEANQTGFIEVEQQE